MSEKINAGKTLLAMAKSLSNKETANESPFILAIDTDTTHSTAVVCADTRGVANLTNTVIGAFVKAMKESEMPEKMIIDLFATMILNAMTDNFGNDEVGTALNELAKGAIANLTKPNEEEE